jgi:hypothetical protein
MGWLWLVILLSMPVSVAGFLIRDLMFRPAGVVVINIGSITLVAGTTLWLLKWAGGDKVPGLIADETPDAPSLIVIAVIYLLPSLLVFLASGGSTKAIHDAGLMGAAEFSAGSAVGFASQVCLVAAVFTLGIVPQTLHRRIRWNDAHVPARNLLLACLTTLTAMATWLYIFLLHFEHGPLAGTPAGVVAVTALGVATLLAPLYSSVVRSFWDLGAVKMVSLAYWRKNWGDLRADLEQAFSQRIAGQTTSDGGPDAGTAEAAGANS